MRHPDRPQWDQTEYVCLFCPEVEPFRPHEGRRRDRHLREIHRWMVVWSCPYCPMRKASNRFDNLRSHVWAVHWRGQPLHPLRATLERLDWREEKEERRKLYDDNQSGHGRGRLRRGPALPKE